MTDVDVKKLAELARIEMSDEELAALEREIPDILAFVEQVQRAHLTGSTSSLQASSGQASGKVTKETGRHYNVMRDDTDAHEAGAYSDELLEALPERSGDYAKVKQVIKRQ